jgi:HEAT repeat protein
MSPLLGDADSDVRQATAFALGGLGNPLAIEPLVFALIDEERTVRVAAETALEQIDSQWAASEAAQRAAARLEASPNDNCAWVRSATMQVLAKLRAPEESVNAGS